MKTLTQFLALSCCLTMHAAQQIVVPNNLASVEGNSSVSEPFNSTSFRFQQVFDASQFSFIGGATGVITRVALRVDGASPDTLMFFGGSSVSLSTTLRGPDELSPVFAENRGIDVLTVRLGAASFSGPPPPPGMTADFDAILSFQTPFFYIPSQGNLLLEVRGGSGQAFLPGALDGHSVVGDSISWVYANSEFPTFGTVDTFGLVTRFDITVVPEPATWLLAFMGLGMLAAFKRR